jgi:large subunit ribosomal protein L22
MAQARAIKRSIQSSPRKMRLMLDLIRGKRVSEALSLLHFTPNHASVVCEQTLRSAIANFQTKPENSGIDIEELWVRECFSDGGAVLKRVLPAPMGRAFRVRKRSNHLTIVVSNNPLNSQIAKMGRKDKKQFENSNAPAMAKAKSMREARTAKGATKSAAKKTSKKAEATATA